MSARVVPFVEVLLELPYSELTVILITRLYFNESADFKDLI
jgi:hypothetical protein